MTVRVVLADDHEVLRDGLVSILAGEPGLEVVASVADGEAALTAVRELAPDVLVIDVQMPRVNGVEAIRRVAAGHPQVRVLCLSMHTDQHLVAEALVAGAAGYVAKGCGAVELVDAIRAVAAGHAHLSAEVTRGVIQELVAHRSQPPPESRLSARERAVLQLIAEGHRSSEIARELSISPKTVNSHREHIMAKLDLHSVAELTKYAVRRGVTGLER